MADTASFAVTGMTCGHCVTSVTEEVSEIAGVNDVDVDLASGLLTVTSDGALDTDAIRSAVRDAGYEVAATD